MAVGGVKHGPHDIVPYPFSWTSFEGSELRSETGATFYFGAGDGWEYVTWVRWSYGLLYEVG